MPLGLLVREHDPDTMGADLTLQSRVVMEPSHTASRPRFLHTALFRLGCYWKPGPEQLRGRVHLSGCIGAASQPARPESHLHRPRRDAQHRHRRGVGAAPAVFPELQGVHPG